MASDAKACFSSKVEYRAVIRYLYLKGKTGKEIQGELADVYGSSAPSYAQVKFWVGEFKRGRMSLLTHPRRSRFVGFFRSQLICIFTVCKGRVYPGSARPG